MHGKEEEMEKINLTDFQKRKFSNVSGQQNSVLKSLFVFASNSMDLSILLILLGLENRSKLWEF